MTEKQLNDRIKKMAKNNRISYPENYDAFICKVLEELPEEPEEADRRSRWKKKKEKSGWAPMPVLLLAALIIVAAGASAGAVVHGYLKRMETMPEQVKEVLVDSVEESEKDIDSFSREFTKEEKKRGEQLAAEYEVGKRYPEKELPVLEDAAMASEHSLCFVRTNSTFYLPEKELTDEELLEIIDFYFKRDYSLMVVEKEKIEEEENIKSSRRISRKKAIELAEGYIKEVYGVNVNSWKKDLEKQTSYHFSTESYFIDFRSNSSPQKFMVEIGLESEECIELMMEYEGKSKFKEGKTISEKEIIKLHQKAILISEKLNPAIKYTKLQCHYIGKKEGKPSQGIINFIYHQGGTAGYVFKYSLNTKQFFSVSKMKDLSVYIKSNENKAEKKGQKIFELELNKSNVAEKEAN